MLNTTNIENALTDFGFDTIYKDRLMQSGISANNDIIKCRVVFPHEGNHNKYMIRMSTNAAFDRWANSVPIEEFFDTENELIEWIKNSKEKIYFELLKYLSEEYMELYEDYNEYRYLHEEI